MLGLLEKYAPDPSSFIVGFMMCTLLYGLGLIVTSIIHQPLEQPQEVAEQMQERVLVPSENFISARQVGPRLFIAKVKLDGVTCLVSYDRSADYGSGFNQDCTDDQGAAVPELTMRQDK